MKPKTMTSATVRPQTLKKLHEIKKFRRWPIADAIDLLADRELEAIRREQQKASAA